jgi:methylated-DNA-[protein]-cysteine S-methyltransferase
LGKTYGVLDQTPVGPVSLMAGDQGLEEVAFASLMDFKARLPVVEAEPSLKGMETISTLLAELSEYFFGIRKVFTVDVDWEVIKGFQKDVLLATAEIPYGEVRTYGELARQLGKPSAAQAVGTALARNPMALVIPCHRVVGSDRKLHGFAAPDGIRSKARLLELEGHTVLGDRLGNKAQMGLFNDRIE